MTVAPPFDKCPGSIPTTTVGRTRSLPPQMDRLEISRRENALLAWGSVALLVVSGGVLVASGEFLTGALAVLVSLLAAGPAAVRRDWQVMAPWGVVALAALPFPLTSFPLLAPTTVYFGIAGVALLLAIYMTAFTDVEITARFAIALVVLTTVAVGTTWAAVRGLADLYLGHSHIGGLAALERDLLIAVGGGILAGLLFEGYFRERSHQDLHGVPVEEA